MGYSERFLLNSRDCYSNMSIKDAKLQEDEEALLYRRSACLSETCVLSSFVSTILPDLRNQLQHRPHQDERLVCRKCFKGCHTDSLQTSRRQQAGQAMAEILLWTIIKTPRARLRAATTSSATVVSVSKPPAAV